MFDPLEELVGNRFFILWHKDPGSDGTDSSCRHAVMRYPYDGDEAAFTADFKRATRRMWAHVHHWRLSRGWLLRRRPDWKRALAIEEVRE